MLKKKGHDNWTALAPEGATAYKIMRHFNHPVKVRKIHYQVVEGKQLAEISSRADRFQSLVLHSLYARVVPGTTEDCALLQCQGQERQLSLSGWLPLTAIPTFQPSVPLPRWVSHWGGETPAKDWFLREDSLLSCGPSEAHTALRPGTHRLNLEGTEQLFIHLLLASLNSLCEELPSGWTLSLHSISHSYNYLYKMVSLSRWGNWYLEYQV